jgi:mRNA interferase MazF
VTGTTLTTPCTTIGDAGVPNVRGEVLLVPFPFSDLSGGKARPVVVVSSPNYQRTTGELIVAMLTSAPRSGRYDCAIAGWKKAGLFLPTWARAKLATLTPRLVLKSLGRLERSDLHRVDDIVRKALSGPKKTG